MEEAVLPYPLAEGAPVDPPPPAPELGITQDTDRIAGLPITDDLFARWYAHAAAPRRVSATPPPTTQVPGPVEGATLPAPSVWAVVPKRDRAVRAAPPSGTPPYARPLTKGTPPPWPGQGAPPLVASRFPPRTAGVMDGAAAGGHLVDSGYAAWPNSSTTTWGSNGRSGWSWGQGSSEAWSGGLEGGRVPERLDGSGEMEWGIPCYPSPPSPCSLPAATVPGLCISPPAAGASTSTCTVGWLVWYPYTYGQRGYPFYSYIS